MSQYFTIYTSAELICLVTALVCLFNAKEHHWRLLIPFLLVTCLVELGAIPLKAIYKAHRIPQNSSAWIYNILMLVQMAVFLTMFYNLIEKYTRSKAIILVSLALLLLIYSVELFYSAAGIFTYNSVTYSVMSVLFILCSLYYYYLLLNSDIYSDLKYSPEFWWVTGTLFFFFGTTAINLFFSILSNPNIKNALYLKYIFNILIAILYGCWSYAFICKRWITPNK